MKKILNIFILLCGLAVLRVQAQLAVPPPTPEYQPFSDEQLDQLMGPIALYPDPLIAQILPASTLPTQIVLADRYVTGGGDPNLIDQQPWDASVQALARYPSVLKYLDDNLNWTTDLGQAFLNQQQDVMNSIQRLRASAQNMGNLQSTPQQQVIDDDGNIEILPADPQVIYVPVYEPDQIYYQNGFGLSFGIGWPIGFWLNCDFDWYHHNLIVWGRDHPRPANWWHWTRAQRNTVIASHTTVWHPANRPAFNTAKQSDRGWNNQIVNRAGDYPQKQRKVNTPVNTYSPATTSRPSRPAPVPEHYESTDRPESSGAFIGIQSSHETKNFSDRGRQSMQTVTHSEPATHYSAPTGGGGGGGSHDSGSKKY